MYTDACDSFSDAPSFDPFLNAAAEVYFQNVCHLAEDEDTAAMFCFWETTFCLGVHSRF